MFKYDTCHVLELGGMMPYSFIYDLTHIPQSVLKRIFALAYETKLHRFLGNQAKRFVKAFKINEATGLNLVDAIALIEDLSEVQVANAMQRDARAYGMELKMGLGLLKKLGIPGQGVFLTKNGCSNTTLNLQNLDRIL